MSELPRSLEVLWNQPARRRRGAQQALTLDRIVAAAIEIADAEGLPALSMARLADRLGSAPMSLYRHIANKDELQVFMLDTAAGEPPVIDADGWRSGLAQWTRALQGVYYRHPWILQVTTGRPPLEPGQLAWLDRGLHTLRDTGLSPGDKLAAVLVLLNFVRGEAGIAAVLLQGDTDPRDMMTWYAKTIATLVDADRFPALAEVVEAGVFEPNEEQNVEFEFGLARILDGIEALVSR